MTEKHFMHCRHFLQTVSMKVTQLNQSANFFSNGTLNE